MDGVLRVEGKRVEMEESEQSKNDESGDLGFRFRFHSFRLAIHFIKKDLEFAKGLFSSIGMSV